MAANVVDLVNQSLRGIGYRHRIADIYEGSPASRAALEIYGQTRDELLRSEDWDFARRKLSLTLLKGPPPPGGYNPQQPWDPTFPAPGWLYEYAYPADMIELGAILPPPFLFPDRDPKPAVFRIDNDPLPVPADPTVPGAKVVLTNIAGAIAVYRARVTDPSAWNPGFTATIVERLAAKLTIALAHDLNLMRATAADSIATGMVADRRRG